MRKRNERGFHGVENRDKVYCSSLRSRFVVSSIKSSVQKTSSLAHRLLAPVRFCKEGGVRVCSIAVLGYFWCGVAVIFISKYGIAVFRVLFF